MAALTTQTSTVGQDPEYVNDRIVFLHIPKTAGSSIHSILSEQYVAEEICPERFDGIASMSEEQLSRYRCFSGHFTRRSVDRIPGKNYVFTFLRNPEKRILSLYYFWRSHRSSVVQAGNLVGPRFARELNLEEFLGCTEAAVLDAVDNAMTRQLVDGDHYLRFEEYRTKAPEKLVENVVDYLKNMEFVGFQENFSNDFNDLLARLHIPVPGVIPNINTRATNSHELRFEEVDEQIITDLARERLQQLTALDQQVYAQAIELFTQKI